MAEEFDNLLVACPNNGGMFLFSRGATYRLDDLDTTGLAVSEELLVRAIQPSSLVMLGTAPRELEGSPGQFDDLHDVLLDGQHCYVVSTRHNEILMLDINGIEVHRWTFPGEPDSWHINCMARWNDRIVFSAFCDRPNHRGYKEPPLDVGFVQDLHTGERLITGLSQPHSLIAMDGHLVLANSGAFELHEYDANGVLVRRRPMGGYTRGIARRGSSIFIGISKSRNVEANGTRSALLVALDADTWEEAGRKVLPVDEIYSIHALAAENTIESLAKISAHASARLSALAQSVRKELASANEVVAESKSRIQVLDAEVSERQRQVFGLLETIHGKDAHIQNRDALIERKDAHILSRDAVIASKEEQLRERDKIIESKEEETRAAHHCLVELEGRLAAMEHSRSWRLTAPLRSMGKAARSVRRFLTALVHVARAPSRYARLVRELGVRGAVSAAKGFMLRGGPQVRPNTPPAPIFNLRLEPGEPVGILTTRHCLFIAELIADALQRLGITSEILFECPPGGYRDIPHFVICPQMFQHLPGLYVAFQMEQSVSSRWFTKDYLQTLENAFAIFDYSIVNIRKLTAMGLSPRQFFYLPIGPLPSYGSTPDRVDAGYEYDVIFYGDINNDRRRAFLAALEKVCKVKVVGNLFGEALHQELRKARLVVNIHYYEGALLETTRLWECLSLGKFVISESSSDMPERADLAELIDFVDVGDIDGMIGRVLHWLSAPEKLERRIRSNSELLSTSCSSFDYFFYRFLLYSGNMDFREFWELVGDRLPAPAEKLCLNLPEYVDRAEAFDKDNAYGFTRFAGLKHPHGWMGCAMSYKFMAMLARKHGLKQLIVCEDDVEFPENFEATWAQVNHHLSEKGDTWDLFSGLLADLHEDANVINAYETESGTYAVIDRMISTVYNVYGEKALDLLARWDEQNYDVESNTIDRYLEHCTQLRVMTTLPFMVGHKEELYSTLWGMQNTQYTQLIEASQKLLARKVEAWMHRNVEHA